MAEEALNAAIAEGQDQATIDALAADAEREAAEAEQARARAEEEER